MNDSDERNTGPPGPAPEGEGPLVSVVTVNFNGVRLLPRLLRSLDRQTYRSFETIVVDNGSTDGSLEMLEREFPEVRVLALGENRGFAAGNNAGIRASKGELVALANSDTEPDPEWLEELVRTVRADPGIGAVASKILFYRPFLPLRLRLGTERSRGRGAREEHSGLLLDEASRFEGCEYRKPVFKEGFLDSEDRGGRRLRRMTRDAIVYLPFSGSRDGIPLQLLLRSEIRERQRTRLRIEVGSAPVAELRLTEGSQEHRVEIPARVVRSESFDLINNAGTDLSRLGDAADRGIYEPDRGQYDREEDVDAFCGAAALLRRSALEEVGLFDEDFFLYYEDTDLSWRLRSRGYRLRYQPRSTIRHLHAASSVEWSPLFVFYTARNKVLMVAKNGGIVAFLRAWGTELRSLAGSLLRWGSSPTSPQARRDLRVRLRVQASLLVRIPRALWKRFGFLKDSVS